MKTLNMYSDALKTCSPRIQRAIVNGLITWIPDLSVGEDDWGGFEFEYPQEILRLFFYTIYKTRCYRYFENIGKKSVRFSILLHEQAAKL